MTAVWTKYSLEWIELGVDGVKAGWSLEVMKSRADNVCGVGVRRGGGLEQMKLAADGVWNGWSH